MGGFRQNHILTSASVAPDGVNATRAWLRSEDCALADLMKCSTEGAAACDLSHYPLASEIIDGAVIYDRSEFPTLGEDPAIG